MCSAKNTVNLRPGKKMKSTHKRKKNPKHTSTLLYEVTIGESGTDNTPDQFAVSRNGGVAVGEEFT